MRRAREGGLHAAAAARRVASICERHDRERAREALLLATQLEPLDPAARLTLARLAAEDGDYDRASSEARAVHDAAVDKAAQAQAAFMLGEIARGRDDVEAARTAYATALALEDALLKIDRSDPAAARWFARARGRLAELDAAAGATERALSGAEAALAMLRASAAAVGEAPVLAADIADAEARLAEFELHAGQATSARRRLGEAIARYEALAVTEQDEPHWRSALADAWALAAEADFVRGATTEAREAIDRALQARLRLAAKYGEDIWALAGVWRRRAALCAATGDQDAAAQSLEQARALAAKLVEGAETLHQPTRFLAHTLLEQSDHALRMGNLELAQRAALEALARIEPHAHAATENDSWLADAALCWDRLSEIARAAGAGEKARDAQARAVEFLRMAEDRKPGGRVLDLSTALLRLGEIALTLDGNAEARASFQESADLRARLCAAAPDDRRSLLAYAIVLERLGLAAEAQADWTAARQAWLNELTLVDRIFPDQEQPQALRFRATVECHLAGLHGSDAHSFRRAALDRLARLEATQELSPADVALKRRLESET